MAEQISVFLDNRPGRLNVLTGILAEGAVNIRALSIQDREEFGLVKLVVDKPQDGILLLKKNGFACALKRIVVVRLKDEIGALHRLTKILSDAGLNVQDAYGFAAQSIFCIESKQVDEMEKVLQDKGLEIVDPEEFYAG